MTTKMKTFRNNFLESFVCQLISNFYLSCDQILGSFNSYYLN